MARKVDSAAMAKAYAAGITAGSTKYKSGVLAVTDNPAAKAKAKVDDGTWAAHTTAAAPRMSAALGAVTLQQWQQQASTVGANNFAGSAAKAGPKYAAVAAKLAAAAQQASSDAEAQADPMSKVRAAINAMKTAFGKPTI